MLLLIAAVTVLAQAAEPERLREAAQRLDTGPASTHEAAWETLVSAGPAGTALLSGLRDGSNARLRDYLDLALFEIRFREQIPGHAVPRRVSYTCKDKPLSVVLGELETLLECQILGVQELDDLATVSLSVKDVRIMDVLHLLAQACQSRIRLEDGVAVLYPPEDAVSEVVAGWEGWKIRLVRFDWFKKWDFRGPREDQLSLALQVSAAPADGMARFHRLVLQEARDTRGRDLLIPPGEPGPRELEGGDSLDDEEYRVLPPSPGTRTLRCLRGYLPLDMVRRASRVTLQNPARERSVTESGISLTVSQLDIEKKHLEASVVLPASLGPARYSLPVRARLQFAPGVRAQFEVSAAAKDDRIDFAIGWASPGNGKPVIPESVAVTVVTESLRRRIPFEFREVELK